MSGLSSFLLLATARGEPPPPWVFPLIFGLIVVSWIPMGFLAGLVSGWTALGRAYRFDGPAPAYRRGRVSGRVGIVNYNNILTIGHDEVGLFMSVMILFRPGHPTLRVPWEAIQRRTRRTYFFFFKFDLLHILVDSKTKTVMLPVRVTAPFEALLPPITEK